MSMVDDHISESLTRLEEQSLLRRTATGDVWIEAVFEFPLARHAVAIEVRRVY